MIKFVAIPALLVALVAMAAEVGQPSSISIMRKGSQPTGAGAPEYFTGAVRVESQMCRC